MELLFTYERVLISPGRPESTSKTRVRARPQSTASSWAGAIYFDVRPKFADNQSRNEDEATTDVAARELSKRIFSLSERVTLSADPHAAFTSNPQDLTHHLPRPEE